MKKTIFILFIILYSSCGEYQKLLKSTDIDLKYLKAVELFNDKQYIKAFPLFEELMTFYRGSNKAQDIYYYYAYTLFGMKNFTLASYHFKNYHVTFINSTKAEEAAFMNAYCYYLDSPTYSLDQASTKKAMDELQLFVNQYPNSKKIEICNKYIDELQEKLEKKAFENAILYHKIMDYQSAIIALNNLLYDYPDTKYREEAKYFQLKSYYQLVKNSIEEKKNQRIKLAIVEFQDFKVKFAKSKYLKEIQSLYSNLIKE